jgi:transcription antitermination factor NusG
VSNTGWSSEARNQAEPRLTEPVFEDAKRAAAEATSPLKWYAVQTRSRHEKVVARQLEGQGFATFLPITTQIRQWSDRRKMVEMPLFPGYTFLRMEYQPEQRLRVLNTDGIVGFVGVQGRGTAIPDRQIEHIQNLLAAQVPFESHPFLKVGQRVRIRSGSLNGTEGILVGQENDRMLVISVELIQRSVSIRVQGYEVEVIEEGDGA